METLKDHLGKSDWAKDDRPWGDDLNGLEHTPEPDVDAVRVNGLLFFRGCVLCRGEIDELRAEALGDASSPNQGG